MKLSILTCRLLSIKPFVAFFATSLTTSVYGARAGPVIDFVESSGKIDVTVNGVVLTSYLWGDNFSKPVLVPIRSLSGIEVTRRYPVTAMQGGSEDHPHHVGVFFAVDQVNGSNFWDNTNRYPQIKHISTDKAVGGEASGVLSTRAEWINDAGSAVLEENRTMIFTTGQHEGEYAIDFCIDLTARANQVVFEDTEEGMFAIRCADWLREPEDGEGVQPGKRIPKESIRGTGRYFSSNGDVRASNVWGKRARWVAIQGIRRACVVGVAILNHPESINFPTYWHARDYGLFSANPLGQGDFQRQDEFERNDPIFLNLTLKKGESCHFRFQIIVFEGLRTKEQIELRFKDYVN